MGGKEKDLRIRSEEELEGQKSGLIEIVKVLEDYSVPYFLWYGTLLGCIREKDFIKWDWDVSVSVFTDDIHLVKDDIIVALINQNFKVLLVNTKEKKFSIEFEKYNTEYEILGLCKGNGGYLRKGHKIPKYLLKDGVIKKELRGEKFNVPKEYIKILEYIYGENWRKPIKTSVSKEYLSDEFYSQKYKKNILNKLKSFVRSFIK